MHARLGKGLASGRVGPDLTEDQEYINFHGFKGGRLLTSKVEGEGKSQCFRKGVRKVL